MNNYYYYIHCSSLFISIILPMGLSVWVSASYCDRGCVGCMMMTNFRIAPIFIYDSRYLLLKELNVTF